jgi:hypothetical protein
MTSSRNGRDQHDLIAVLDGRFHALQVFDIVFADEQVDERTQFTSFIEQMWFDGWELHRQVVQGFGNFRTSDGHFAFAAGIGAQRGWDSQCGHVIYFISRFVFIFFHQAGHVCNQRDVTLKA